MKGVICEEAARICREVYRDRLRALVLTGSLARDEATFVKDDDGARLLGDAEFLLVFDERTPLPCDADIDVIRDKLVERIGRRGLRAEVALCPVRPDFLRTLPPTIFAYELRHCGETVAGDPALLSLVPDFPPSAISLEDAWRMLANRIVEQLESVGELVQGRRTLSPASHYRTVKLHLDMATSLLVFAGRYAPTYEQRAGVLASMAEAPTAPGPSWAFPLRPFADDVAVCTRWKLGAMEPAGGVDRWFYERAVRYAQDLWRWELARLQEGDFSQSPSALMTAWMRRQPYHQRLRGWAYVTRKCGWHRSWPHWSRWLRLAGRGSPRYLVYAVAGELLFVLPELTAAGADRDPRPCAALGRALPVQPAGHRPAGGPWQRLAADVLWNYEQFLTGTRA